MTSVSVTASECPYVKSQSRALTARELPCNTWICADKTRPLVACDTAFYAIMSGQKYVNIMEGTIFKPLSKIITLNDC